MLEFSHVNFGYGAPLLQDINITFPGGKITTIIGPNGCGKSTLLKLAAGLLRPQSGNINLGGKDISQFRAKEYARRAAILLQSERIPQISVKSLAEHGRFPYLSYHRRHTAEDKNIIENALETTGVAHLRHKNLNQLSGGERQRAFIAMALAQDTDLLMLDEPTTYLDINHQLEIMNLVQQLNTKGKTIIMVLHDLNLALHNSHHLLLMNQGKIITAGTAEKISATGEIDAVFNIRTTSVPLEGKNYFIFRPQQPNKK